MTIKTTHPNIINQFALFITCVFIFLIPWGDSIKDGLPAIVGLASFAVVGLSIISGGSHRDYSIFHLMVIGLWVWSLITLMWTQNYESGIEVAKRAIQIMILPFLFTLIITNKERILIAYQSFVLGSFVGSCIIISNYLNGIQSPYYNRYGLANIETDLLGIMLAFAIPIGAYLNNTFENKWLKILNLFLIPIIVYAIFLTGTRTATLISIVGVLYWLYSQRKAPMKIKVSVFLAILLSVTALITIAPKASLDRAFSSGESISSGTLNYRTVIWGASLESWKESPIVGTGLGSLKFALGKKHVNYSGAHNVYVEILTETGIVGLIIYIILLFSILNLILHTPSSEKVYLFSLFFMIIVSQMAQHSHYQKETWFVLTMLAIHAYSMQKQTPS